MSTEKRLRASGGKQEGFALALVIFLLFAIAVAGATGYQVVRTGAFQSQQCAETSQSLAVAQAGLDWFIGGQRGIVPDTFTLEINGGTAVVTATNAPLNHQNPSGSTFWRSRPIP
ncbi:hypothetical protein ACFL0I_04855, partial [Gemmatimonadota bacterium]